MRAADIRAWAGDQREAAARERDERRGRPMTAREAFEAAMSLLVLDERLNGSPFRRHDPVSEREDAEAGESWTRLRARWTRGR